MFPIPSPAVKAKHLLQNPKYGEIAQHEHLIQKEAYSITIFFQSRSVSSQFSNQDSINSV